MTALTHRSLIDTNILVYAHDVREPVKRAIARELLGDLHDRRLGVLSVQVLNEFYAVVTRLKRGIALDYAQAQELVHDLALAWDVLPLTVATSLRAIRSLDRYHLSFWDALIWATARENGLQCVLSEDFQHGQEIEEVRFINPFMVAT